MVMCPTGLRNKNECAGEDQQQLTQPIPDRHTTFNCSVKWVTI
jgi:hypothetical protein